MQEMNMMPGYRAQKESLVVILGHYGEVCTIIVGVVSRKLVYEVVRIFESFRLAAIGVCGAVAR